MIDVHQLVTFTSASLLLVVLSATCFRRSPATRRWFILLGGVMLLVVPMLLKATDAAWTLPVSADTYRAVSLLSISIPAAFLWTAVIGALALVFWRVGIFVRARRYLSRLPNIADHRLEQIVREQRDLLGLRAAVKLHQGREACSASGRVGIVVLPSEWRSWSESTLRSVLLHELTHVRRRDDLCILSANLLSDLLWFLPWMCVLPSLLERAVEESCDDHAASHLQSATYLESLALVARQSVADSGYRLPAMARHHLLVRMARFLTTRRGDLNSAGLYWLLVLLTVTLGLTWSAKLKDQGHPGAHYGRVVAIAAPVSNQQFELSLAHEERGPPSPLRRNAD